ncbi:unnamed protein product [Debaryomyces tyrocola]|nr:unnamed protein product [Debaryomyces tyrocola]
MFSISVRSIKEPPISRISIPDEKWQTGSRSHYHKFSYRILWARKPTGRHKYTVVTVIL